MIMWARLVVYATRMASFAVRRGDLRGVWHGLLGLVIDPGRLDPHDVHGRARVAVRCRNRPGGDPKELFRRAETFATPRRVADFEALLTAPKFMRDPKGMGYTPENGEAGFVYRYTTWQ